MLAMLIPLTQGKVAVVDLIDYRRLSQRNWMYALNNVHGYGYAVRRDDGQTVYMHREVMSGIPRIDHRNNDTLDNRRENLRAATSGQNRVNQRGGPKTASGYWGVEYRTDRGNWRAKVRKDGKQYYRAGFATAEEAARARDELAKEHWGEFVRLNFPNE